MRCFVPSHTIISDNDVDHILLLVYEALLYLSGVRCSNDSLILHSGINTPLIHNT